ncbi:MAG: DUF664 domain-containing protein [Flavisolibacter sp.]|nr:DUF664 domain-containing protein [Flavisolibacter sp.]
MDKRNLYLISEISGFTPQIARLVSMMNYVRHTTLSAVEGLTVSELDYLNDSKSNSIGSLLLHIAAAEVGYQAATFYNRQMNEEEQHEWETALALGEKARQEIKGHGLDYYLNKLEQVRTKTLAELASRDDQWLDEQTSFGSDNRINNYFKWFHVFTHEANHRGQIRLLRRQAKQGSSGA